jgi:hypothetical protein
MAQAVSLQPLTAEAWVLSWSVHVGFVVEKVALVQDFSLSSLVFLMSISAYRGSQYSYISWKMSNRPVGGRSSET